MSIKRQIFYAGRVQGVGFRYTVKRIAAGFEVTGWVRNLPDGRVELQVLGDDSEVEDFLQTIATGQLQHHIRQQTEGSTGLVEQNEIGFTIRH